MRKLLMIAFVGIALSVPSVAMSGSRVVEKKDFKGKWPFTFEKVELRCIKRARYAVNPDDGSVYALTGFAQVMGKKYGAQRLDSTTSVWLDGDFPGTKVSLSDISDAAGALCKE